MSSTCSIICYRKPRILTSINSLRPPCSLPHLASTGQLPPNHILPTLLVGTTTTTTFLPFPT